jgi:hypothetical protein
MNPINFDPVPFQQLNMPVKGLEIVSPKSYRFDDGNDEVVDLFAIKVGVNGNGFGVGLPNFDENVDLFMDNPIIVDPFGITHKNENEHGKYSKEYILQNQPYLTVGKVSKIKKYDLDGDGKNDFARILGNISKEEKKKKLYHAALAAGIDESSPTIEPLDPINEPADNLTKWRPLNIALVKHGAYLGDAKIKAICKGNVITCHNALAAALEETKTQNNNTPLIELISYKPHMTDPSEGNKDSGSSQGQPNNANGPLVAFYGNTDLAKSFNSPNSSGRQPATKGESNEPPNGNGEKKPEENKPDEQTAAILKENEELRSFAKHSLLNEIAPIDMFEGNADQQKEFHKRFKSMNVGQLKEYADLFKDHGILLVQYITKSQKQTSTKDEKKDEEKKNPLAAAMNKGFPEFDNSASEQDREKSAYDYLNKMSLRDLNKLEQKMKGNVPVGVIGQ